MNETADPVLARLPAHPRDRFSTWSLTLLGLFACLQILAFANLRFNWPYGPHSRPGAPFLVRDSSPRDAADLSDDALEDLIGADMMAKAYYAFSNVLNNLPPADKLPNLRRQALAEAEDGLRSDPDSPAFAERIIILRAESGFEPLALVSDGKKHPPIDPLAAFQAAADQDPTDQYLYLDEAIFWREVMTTNHIPRAQVPILEAQTRRFISLRWYSNLALHQIYIRSGEQQKADTVLKKATSVAVTSVAGVGVLSVFVCLLFLTATIVLLFIWVKSIGSKDRVDPPSWLDQFMIPAPDTVPLDERRLRAGDLLDVFTLYMISLQAVGFIVELILDSYLKTKGSSLDLVSRVVLTISATSAAYIIGSFFGFMFLLARARAVGASIRRELGLRFDRTASSVGFGVIGWGIGLVLIIAVTTISEPVFKGAPAPSNPALPLMIAAPNIAMRVLLYVLAAVCAPFFEELFFRGTLMNALRLRFGNWPAIVGTGLVFGFVHPVGIAQAVTLAVLGMVLAWIAFTRKSLLPSMTTHCLQNTYAFLELYFAFSLVLPRW